MEWHLCAAANYQTIIFIPIRDDHMRLNMGLLNFRYLIGFLKNMIRLFKPLLHIANIDADLRRQISFRIRFGKVNILWLIMDLWCPGAHRFRCNKYGWKWFVFHLNQLECLVGDLLGLRRHERYPIAYESNFFIQRKCVKWTRDRVGLSSS